MSTDTREALAALPPLPEPFDVLRGHENEGAHVFTAEQMQAYARAALATKPAHHPVMPEGFALVPLRMNAEMERVTEQEDWQWEDLLEAAEAITLKQYDDIAAQPSAQPVAWIEHTVGGSIALCSTQEAYKVPMGVRFYLIPVQTKQQG